MELQVGSEVEGCKEGRWILEVEEGFESSSIFQKAVKRHWETCHPVSKLPFCALNSKERVSFVHRVDEDDESSSSSSESDKFSTDSE